MTIPCKAERSQLSHEEFEIVRVTHHPAIYDLTGEELRALKLRLREQRDRARAMARQRQREIRRKAEPRGKGFPGTVEQPLRRKQIFATALKRVNNEIDRLRKLEGHTAHVQAARAALALQRAAKFVHHPAPVDTPREGMQSSRPSVRRLTKVPPAKIGSVSQATKIAQAIRDSRTQ
jgi:hypothetical protein